MTNINKIASGIEEYDGIIEYCIYNSILYYIRIYYVSNLCICHNMYLYCSININQPRETERDDEAIGRSDGATHLRVGTLGNMTGCGGGLGRSQLKRWRGREGGRGEGTGDEERCRCSWVF